MKILLIHGIGNPEKGSADWSAAWRETILAGLKAFDTALTPEFATLSYDRFFAKHVPLIEYAEALTKLLAAPILRPEPDSRGWIGDQWNTLVLGADAYPGMVARWASEDRLRADLRRALIVQINAFEPDMVFAHSLGGLIAYDTFLSLEGAGVMNDRYLVTFGTQVANLFVKDEVFGGVTEAIPGARFWFNLYNPSDPVFVAPIREKLDRFEQIIRDSAAGHSPVTDDAQRPGYLETELTRDHVYRLLAEAGKARKIQRTTESSSPAFKKATEKEADAVAKHVRKVKRITAKPNRRALIVAIDDYRAPIPQLHGCVNDAYLMSSVLQEIGFDATDIRLVLNERATKHNILERLSWLLDGAEDGQERVLVYSGHGAQIPDYGAKDEVDHVDETLVTYDFDWDQNPGIRDKEFCQFYSALPHGTKFYAIFDCCHSGGIARDNGISVRGLSAPDDIRHRMLKWKDGMWQPRKFKPLNPDFGGNDEDKRLFMGENLATQRFGKAMSLRSLTGDEYDNASKKGAKTPYMPVIFEACQEGDVSYEYRHGATSQGAFTFSLAEKFRQARRAGKNPTFKQMADEVNVALAKIGYAQRCQVEGPDAVIKAPMLR